MTTVLEVHWHINSITSLHIPWKLNILDYGERSPSFSTQNFKSLYLVTIFTNQIYLADPKFKTKVIFWASLWLQSIWIQIICIDLPWHIFLFSEHVLISSLDILFTIQFAILPACLHLILRLKKKKRQTSKGIIIASNSPVLKLILC